MPFVSVPKWKKFTKPFEIEIILKSTYLKRRAKGVFALQNISVEISGKGETLPPTILKVKDGKFHFFNEPFPYNIGDFHISRLSNECKYLWSDHACHIYLWSWC